MDFKLLYLTVALVLTVVAFVPYLVDIFRKKTKPHAFSWLVFSLVSAIAFLAQLSRSGGVGSWLLGFSALMCFIIFILALMWGTRKFDKLDWALLLLSLISIIVWVSTSEPLFSVVLVSLIEVIAFVPALRKGYAKPYEETISTYVINFVRFALGIAALSVFGFTTVLFPATAVATNIIFVIMLIYRRRVVG